MGGISCELSDLVTTPRRLTLRCSGPGWHKVHGRGRSAFSSNQRRRARVLSGRRPAAELGSWATLGWGTVKEELRVTLLVVQLDLRLHHRLDLRVALTTVNGVANARGD